MRPALTPASGIPVSSATRGVLTTWLDHDVAGHCERVSRYASELAQAVGIQGEELAQVEMGGLLHDVGKVAVPREVMVKPGRLNAGEWVHVKIHPAAGEKIAAAMGLSYAVRKTIRHHHERWDGQGYPDGLSGRGIPLHARIVCIADVFDALSSPRIYHVARSPGEALREMERWVGRRFDPGLFAAFSSRVTERTETLGAGLNGAAVAA